MNNKHGWFAVIFTLSCILLTSQTKNQKFTELGDERKIARSLMDGATLPANDIFSLGVIFYRLLSRHLPFEGETPIEIMRTIINKNPPDVSVFRPDVPGELNDLVKKMIARKPGQRPPAEWIRNTILSLC